MLTYNYPKYIRLFNTEKRRVLTPIGRATVAKIIILPKLNHLFISLPIPKKSFLYTLDNAHFQFLWKSKKRNKVKRQIVTQEMLKGGLKMLDTYNFVCSLKCSWIKTLTLHYKPWMDIFIAMNSSGIVRKILDFGDSFIQKMIKQNNISELKHRIQYLLTFYLIHGGT